MIYFLSWVAVNVLAEDNKELRLAKVLREETEAESRFIGPVSRMVYPETVLFTDRHAVVQGSAPYMRGGDYRVEKSGGNLLALLIDFGCEVGGFSRIRFKEGSLLRLGVEAAESSEQLVSRWMAEIGSRIDWTIMYRSFTGAAWRTIELPHRGGFRYLNLVPHSRGWATLDSVELEYTSYLHGDRSDCGYFLCSDELLNRIWYMCIHSLEVCTVDPALGGVTGKTVIGKGKWVLVDGAKRDRLIWTGDLVPMAEAAYVSNFNVNAVADSLRSLAEHQTATGYIPACSPVTVPGKTSNRFFGEYVAWWVVCLHQYYLSTGDLETLKELFSAAKKAMVYLDSQTRDGLFYQTPFNWMEWCYTIIRRGFPSYTNGVYRMALLCAAEMAEQLGDKDVARLYVSRAERVQKQALRLLWDESRGVFVDTTVDRQRVPQDGNALGVLSDMVEDRKTIKGMLDYLRENLWRDWGSVNVDIPYYRMLPKSIPHNQRVLPFMNYFEVLARLENDDGEGGVELIRRCWGNMVDQEPNTTGWEWCGVRGGIDGHHVSLCHGCAAGAAALLSRYVLGVRPIKPGYEEFVVDPYHGDLDWVEGRVPTPRGLIKVRWEKTKSGYSTKVDHPPGTKQVSK